MQHESPQAIHLKDYRPPEFLIDRADLYFDLHEDRTRVRSLLEIRRNPDAMERNDFLRLDGEGLSLDTAELDGQPLPAARLEQDASGLTVKGVPDRFKLQTEVLIRPRENTALEGLYKSGDLFCSQCEAEGFRKITFFLDRPDVMTQFSTSVEADRDKYPCLLSNGNLEVEDDLENGRHRARWVDPFPKPCYLFALVAGDLKHIEDRFTTASGQAVSLRIYVEPENIEKCDHAMSSLKHAMAWDEAQYGREYDLDIYMIVAVNDFNMGAMENKGLNVFNSKFVLARPETATDQDFQGIEGVIAHEYFHNWTGNRITCRDWFQLSLKEGFTVFRDQCFSADMGSAGVKRVQDVHRLRAHQFAEDASPMAHPVRPASYIEINNFYTVTVYEKGAEVVRMQHNLLGPETFRQATDLYFERHDGQAVTTDDFVQCMADASGRDLSQFRLWYSQAGTPEVAVTADYDAADRRFTLHCRQSCPPSADQERKPPLHIPFAVGLLDADGEDLPLQLAGEAEARGTTRVLELRAEQESFVFEGVSSKPVPSLLRGFSAPVKVQCDFSDDELMFLMARDSDGFNRWDAAQTLGLRILLRRLQDDAYAAPAGFIAAFRQALNEPDPDRALLAEVLDLPAESYLGEQMQTVDVDGIHRAREAVKRALAEALHDDLLQAYDANRDTEDYAITTRAIARRSLKNRCLDYLMQAAGEAATERCLAQYHEAGNMTDRQAALALIAHSDLPEREAVLADFAERFAQDPLVLDKWFSVQAASKRPDTLQRVQGLMGHPAFSIRNPNKVRALIGAFSSANPVRFHAADGSGYAFLADRVLELDRLNPQVAARLARGLTRWKRYDETRAAAMKGQLERIKAAAGVSRDLFEIVNKSL